MNRELISLAEMAKRGPFSENGLRWLVLKAKVNGLSEHRAIVRIGRRVYVDRAAFDRWIDSQNGSAGVPA
jgi:hypothetical protein